MEWICIWGGEMHELQCHLRNNKNQITNYKFQWSVEWLLEFAFFGTRYFISQGIFKYLCVCNETTQCGCAIT